MGVFKACVFVTSGIVPLVKQSCILLLPLPRGIPLPDIPVYVHHSEVVYPIDCHAG